MSQYLRNLKKAKINRNCLRLVTTAVSSQPLQSLPHHAKEALGDETFHGVGGRLFCQGSSSGYFGKLFLTRMKTLTYMKRPLTWS